jgi:hypothetical protein
MGLESTAGNKLKIMVGKGDPLFSLVQGGRLQCTRCCPFRFLASPALLPPVTRRPSACLLRSFLAPSCTLMSYSFFLSVV